MTSRPLGTGCLLLIVAFVVAIGLGALIVLLTPTRDRPADVTPTATETRAVVVVRTDPTRAVAMPPSATPTSGPPEPILTTPTRTSIPPTLTPSPTATFTPKPATPTAPTQKG